MAPIYEHRQVGTLSVLALAIGLAVLVGILAGGSAGVDSGRIIASVVGVALILALLIFGSLTVSVDREHVTVRFGPGLIRKRFRVAYILQALPVRNHWYYGWGIRLTPHGWLFNVSGLDAVELRMADGRTYRVGTDEPQALAAAIARARGTR